ncbi:hypothetical protein BY458DRAFT_3499 [Sporodiniella umbellata]|nr:hypothetical protein BY458DRAFT_3499 [Sporodiniella umbellata]
MLHKMSTSKSRKEIQIKNLRKNSNGYNKIEKSVESLSFQELEALYSKTQSILNNSTIQLPDGGAKLKAKLEQIKKVQNSRNDTLTQKVSEMSLSDRPNSRKDILDHATSPKDAHTLLKPHLETEAKGRSACVISLEESIRLQDTQQKDIKEANMKKRLESITRSMKTDSLTDELNQSMGRLRLSAETSISHPDDDGSSDGEGRDADSIDDESDDDDDDDDNDDNDRLLYAEDDEGFDEDETVIIAERRQR